MLTVSVGQASLAGRQGSNQDFFGCVTPEGEILRDKGAVFAVADGVGHRKGGRDAAEMAVRLFLSDYYSSPDTWSVRKCLEHVMEHVNATARETARSGGAATFAGLVLKGRRYFTVHAGDARIYLLRRGELRRLTEDHIWEQPDFRNVVSRAVGLDVHLHPDFSQDALQAGDVFLLCTDGFFKAREPASESLKACLAGDLQHAAEELAAAVPAGNEDDITLQLLRVETLPPEDDRAVVDLPLAVDVREGMTIDSFYLAKLLHRGQLSEVYLADDLRHGRKVALKFPRRSSGTGGTFGMVDRFLREEWVGRRVNNPHVLPALPLEAGRRSCLYYATPWQSGETLRRRLERGGLLPASKAVDIGIQICRGLEALHHLRVLHRDIKPDNVLINGEGNAVLLDLGVAHAEAFASEEGVPGTPSYMAPEMFGGADADERTEIYALGVTLYELLSRKFPYGEIEPFTQPRFHRWTPPSRYNPDIPLWLETVLQKATEVDPSRRFQALSEMQFHLERRERVPGEETRRASPVIDIGLTRWKITACAFAMLAVIEFILLMNRR